MTGQLTFLSDFNGKIMSNLKDSYAPRLLRLRNPECATPGGKFSPLKVIQSSSEFLTFLKKIFQCQWSRQEQ